VAIQGFNQETLGVATLSETAVRRREGEVRRSLAAAPEFHAAAAAFSSADEEEGPSPVTLEWSESPADGELSVTLRAAAIEYGE
jgi:hypothetical protein